MRVRDILRRNLTEIDGRRDLTAYGAFLAASHAFTFFWWYIWPYPSMVVTRSQLDAPALCWPFFPECWRISFSHDVSTALGGIYFAASVAVALLFLQRRTKPAYLGLAALTAFRVLWFSLDVRFQGNFHYMVFIVSGVYLFLPGKNALIRMLIVLFYVGAGTLKLNAEWLSGASLLRSPGISGPVLEVLLAYAVILELVVVFGLFSSRAWVRWLVLTQLLLFHAFSWPVVSFFYPLTMACLVSIFPLTWLMDRGDATIPWRRLHFAQWIVVGLFVLAQLMPRLQRGDPVLRGGARMLALSMLDGSPLCFFQIFVRYKATTIEIQPMLDIPIRIKCDPLILWNLARQQCRENKDRADFEDVDIAMSSRRATDVQFTPVVSYSGFCSKSPSYNVLGANEWIL